MPGTPSVAGRPRHRRRTLLVALVATVALPTAAHAAEPLTLLDRTEPIGPGVTLRHLKTLEPAGWFDRQVLTVNLANRAVSTDLLTGSKVSNSSRTTSAKVNAAGAVAGINGDFSDVNGTQAASGAEIQNGTLLKSADATPWSQIGVGRDGIGRVVDMAVQATATFGGAGHEVRTLNTSNFYGAIGQDDLIAYTPAWGVGRRISGLKDTTDVAEALISGGKVVAVNASGADAAPIPDDGFTLLGRGASATAIRALRVGDDASLAYGLKDDVAKQLKFGIGAQRELVRDGVARPDSELDADVHPRTMVGFKDGGRTMLLVTADGRQTSIPGMTMSQQAAFMVSLGAEFAFNMDGGGSSTMVARPLGATLATVRNTPSDGTERAIPNGIGVFVAPGSGKVDDLVVTPSSEEAAVFPGLGRTLTAKAVDDHQTPVPLARGDVRWSVSDGTVDNGLVRAPKDASGTIRVRSTADGVQAETAVRVLKPLKSLELSSNRLSLTEPVAANATTVKVTGRDDQGFTAPVEMSDLDLDYDHAVVRITPADDGLKITPLGNGGTVLTATAAGRTVKLPITVGVQTSTPYTFKGAGAVAARRWEWAGSGGNTLVTDSAKGVEIPHGAVRNVGITAVGGGATLTANQIPLPGQPLRVRVELTATSRFGLSYIALAKAGGGYANLYGGPVEVGTHTVEVTVPSDVSFPIRVDTIQAIETDLTKQAAGTLTVGDIQVDVPSEVELPEQEPVRPDDLVSPDGRTNGKDDWAFATLSDVQFTHTQPELAKVGVASLERIRKTKPDLIVLNGDITDQGEAEDMTLARATLEAGGCRLIPLDTVIGKDDTPAPTDDKTPCYYVPGNHESYRPAGQGDLAPFQAEFGKAYGTFDHKGTRFVLLNSALGSFRGSDFEQLPMLREALDAAADDPTVDNVAVFAHHPVDDPAETKSSQLTDRVEVDLIEKLLSDFRAASGKGVTMTGSHAQIADVHRVEGVPYTVLPSSGKAPYGVPDRGGFTGWLRWSVDRDAGAGDQWLTQDVRAFAQSIDLNAPDAVEVGTTATLSGSIVQPSGVQAGTRVVPLRYPMSVHWSGDDGLAIGSGAAAIDAARRARKVAILDPVTRALTALRQGTVKVAVTNDSMREFTGAASLAPIVAERTITVGPSTGPGPKLSANVPVFVAQPAGTTGVPQTVTVTNTGDLPLAVGDVRVEADAGFEGDFVLAAESCRDGEIAPGASCRVLVRFSPAKAGVTSTGRVVLRTNTADGEHAVALRATSVDLPKSEPGSDGKDGAEGAPGSDGVDGAQGVPGTPGVTGPAGPQGVDGGRGANGGPGPAGAAGAAGPKGARGPAGRSPRVAVSCKLVRKRRAVSCTVRTQRASTGAAATQSAAKTRIRVSVRLAGRRRTSVRAGDGRVTVRLAAGGRALRPTSRIVVQARIGRTTQTVTVRPGARTRVTTLR